MKKIISILSALFLVLCVFTAGCSCSGESYLSFSIETANSEKMTYSIKFAEDYLGNYKKSAETDNAFKYNYDCENATFVTELQPVHDLPEKIKNNDIVNSSTVNKAVYKYTTKFRVPLTVTVNGTEYTHNETVETTAYVADKGVSLAPIYAIEQAEYYEISASNEKAVIKILKTETETLYSTEEFTTTKKYKEFDIDTSAENITLENVTPIETTEEYTFRAAIDNAELLFAIRGIELSSTASISIPVISPSYNKPTALKITNVSSATNKFEINGEEQDKTYNTLSFCVDNTNTSGLSQYVKVQSPNTKNGNALLLEYAKPLICIYNGKYASMGWLVLTLSEIA